MNKALLTSREYAISLDNPFFKDYRRINWYCALDLLRSKKSVKMCDFYDTTNSGGEWGGYIVQELNGTSYLILFSQEGRGAFSMGGYTIYTDTAPIASWRGEMDRDSVETIISDHITELNRIYR